MASLKQPFRAIRTFTHQTVFVFFSLSGKKLILVKARMSVLHRANDLFRYSTRFNFHLAGQLPNLKISRHSGFVCG